jgi:hypothetical protein
MHSQTYVKLGLTKIHQREEDTSHLFAVKKRGIQIATILLYKFLGFYKFYWYEIQSEIFVTLFVIVFKLFRISVPMFSMTLLR